MAGNEAAILAGTRRMAFCTRTLHPYTLTDPYLSKAQRLTQILLQKRFGIVAAVAHLSSAQTEAHRQKYGSGCKAKDESLGSLRVRPLKTQVLQLKCVSFSLPQLVLSFRLCSILL